MGDSLSSATDESPVENPLQRRQTRLGGLWKPVETFSAYVDNYLEARAAL